MDLSEAQLKIIYMSLCKENSLNNYVGDKLCKKANKNEEKSINWYVAFDVDSRTMSQYECLFFFPLSLFRQILLQQHTLSESKLLAASSVTTQEKKNPFTELLSTGNLKCYS